MMKMRIVVILKLSLAGIMSLYSSHALLLHDSELLSETWTHEVIRVLRSSAASECHSIVIRNEKDVHQSGEIFEYLGQHTRGITLYSASKFGEEAVTTYLDMGRSEDFCLNVIYLLCHSSRLQEYLLRVSRCNLGRFLATAIFVMNELPDEEDILPSALIGDFYVVRLDGRSQRYMRISSTYAMDNKLQYVVYQVDQF